MTRDMFRAAIAPAYLFLCLILGGSAQGAWGVAVLQILAILIIAWSFALPSPSPLPKPIRQLAWLLAATIALLVVHMLPLPSAIWTQLPGRGFVADGRAILGLPLGWSSLSLAPYDTAAALLALLPSLAILCAMIRLKAFTPVGLALAVLAATVAGVLLGALQTSSADPINSPWYLYKFSNFGVATGFFANSNHMASLLLVAIPFTVALAAHAGRDSKEARKRHTLMVLGAAGLGLILIGIAINGSLTGYGLMIPVTLASLLMVIPLGRGLKQAAIGISVAGLLAFLALLFSPLGDRLPGAATSVSTRQAMLVDSVEAFGAFAPVGAGFGTFPKIFPLFEDADRVDRTYVNHAHNDYLELAVETGVPGMILVLLFLTWWAAAVRRMLASPAADGFAMAGAIGSASILVHSAVDYPLRTSAMSALFAVCLALILLSRRSAGSKTDIRPTRHLVID